MSLGLQKTAENKYRKESNLWCDVCRVYIKNHLNAVRNHEQGKSHKEKLADRARRRPARRR